MIITDDRWNDIVKATEAKIASWNASATKDKWGDTFSVTVRDSGGYVVLLTEHNHGSKRENRVVVREIATGELRRATVKKRRRRGLDQIVGFTIKTPDPKAWQSLPGKSADAAVRQLRLADFVVFISARHIPSDEARHT
jgi:hypothetical protein